MLKRIGVAMLAILVFLSLVAMSRPVFAIVGDVNGDGIVNMVDVSLVIDAFMSYPGHPKWNPSADLNNDLNVNMLDLAIVLSNFGQHV
jgi:hypothetical protein